MSPRGPEVGNRRPNVPSQIGGRWSLEFLQAQFPSPYTARRFLRIGEPAPRVVVFHSLQWSQLKLRTKYLLHERISWHPSSKWRSFYYLQPTTPVIAITLLQQVFFRARNANVYRSLAPSGTSASAFSFPIEKFEARFFCIVAAGESFPLKSLRIRT